MPYLKQFLLITLALAFSFTALVTPTQAAGPFPNCRLGVGGIENGVTGYNLAQLNMGLYLDWQSRSTPPAGLPEGSRYLQVIRVHQKKTDSNWQGGGPYVQPPAYSVYPSLSVISSWAASQPGSTWEIGNEVERRDWYVNNTWGGQDEIMPELYATAFHDIQAVIKAADPTAKVAIGSLIEATPLRLKYLDRVWNSYYDQYGYSMGQDIDVWNIHGFILREVHDSWGAEIPVGLNDTGGFLYGADTATILAAHRDINNFKEFTLNLREWMAAHGERNKPLINTEFGILYKSINGQTITTQQVNDYMKASFDYLFTATDPNLGYPADENRLVQGWVWYSVQDKVFNGNLFNPNTKALTSFGNTWKSYVTDPNKPLASQPQRNLLVTNLKTTPNPTSVIPGQTTTVTLQADIANSGNTWTNTGNNIQVKFWDGVPGGAGSNLIGTLILNDLPGCGQLTHVTMAWSGLHAGNHTWYVQAVPIANETHSNDNVASSSVEVIEAGSANLVITQVDNPDPVLVGGSLTYTATVTNNGPDLAVGVALTETISGSANISQIISSQGSCTGTNPITCNLGNLANGSSATVTTVATPTAGGTLTNVAQVASTTYDPNPLNNTGIANSTVTAPTLQFSSATYSATEIRGSALITVTRTGQSGGSMTVNYSTEDDTAIAGTDYITTSGVLTWAANDLSSKSFTVPIVDNGAPESNRTVKLNLSNPGGGAELGSPKFAILTIVDDDSASPPQADLRVTKTGAPNPVLVGNKLTYTIQVTNDGPVTATGVSLFDDLPVDATLASISTTQGVCSGTSLITCDLNALAQNMAVTVTIGITPTQVGSLINTVNVTGNENDPDLNDNNASATTLVTSQGAIKVQTYHDRNGNGQKENGDSGLNGWSLILYDAQDQVLANDTSHTLNGETGWVRFGNLSPGTYKVCELQVGQGNWANSDPGGGTLCKSVSLATSTAEKTIRLGNYQYGSLTVVKEANIIHTFSFTGTLPAFSLTSSSSQNSRKFSNLSPGSYLIAENQASLPPGEWYLSQVTCQDANHQPSSMTVDLANYRTIVPLSSGQVLTCTFYNEQKGLSDPNSTYLPLILH